MPAAPTLRGVFEKYSSNQISMDFSEFTKLAQDCGLLAPEKKPHQKVKINININVGVDANRKPVLDSQQISNLVQKTALPQIIQAGSGPKMNKAGLTKQKTFPITVSDLDQSFKGVKEHSKTSTSISFQQFEEVLSTLSSRAGTSMEQLVARMRCPPSTPAVERLRGVGSKKLKAKRQPQRTQGSLAVMDQGGVPWIQRSGSTDAQRGPLAGTAASKMGPRWLRLHEVYDIYACEDGMDAGQFARLCEECEVVNAECSAADVSAIFAAVSVLPKIQRKKAQKASQEAPLSGHRMSFNQFLSALEKCAMRRGEPAEDFKKRVIDRHAPPAPPSLSKLHAEPEPGAASTSDVMYLVQWEGHKPRQPGVKSLEDSRTRSLDIPRTALLPLPRNRSLDIPRPAPPDAPLHPRSSKPGSALPKPPKELWSALKRSVGACTGNIVARATAGSRAARLGTKSM